MFHLIEKTTNGLRIQSDATNFEFRKRIYELNRAKEELEHQMKQVDDFILFVSQLKIRQHIHV